MYTSFLVLALFSLALGWLLLLSLSFFSAFFLLVFSGWWDSVRVFLVLFFFCLVFSRFFIKSGRAWRGCINYCTIWEFEGGGR